MAIISHTIKINFGSGVSGSSVAKTQVIRQALASTDDLFHSALYTWFIEQGYVDELLHVSLDPILCFYCGSSLTQLNSNFLETFLVNQKDNIDMANLLWRYYVIHGRFKEAALVLSELADVPG